VPVSPEVTVEATDVAAWEIALEGAAAATGAVEEAGVLALEPVPVSPEVTVETTDVAEVLEPAWVGGVGVLWAVDALAADALAAAGVLGAGALAAGVLEAAGALGVTGLLGAAGALAAGVLGAAGALGVTAELEDAGTLDGAGDPDAVGAEVAELTADRTWPTTEEGAAVGAEDAPGTATVPGPLAADAGRAVRSDSAMNAPKPAKATPAAHRQGRRTLVTRVAGLAVTSVTIARHSGNS
jgi:hypothetical protein